MPDKGGSVANTKRHKVIVEEVETPEVNLDKAPGEEIKTEVPETPKEDVSTTPSEFSQNRETSAPENNSLKEDGNHDETDVIKEKSPVFWILIPGIFILGAILGGIFFYQNEVNVVKMEESPAPTNFIQNIPEPTPTPKTEEKVDVSKFEVSILNGSGISGEAGKAKNLLESAGFIVASTGNAATYDYTKTIIKTKSEVGDSVIKKLEDSLFEVYEIGEKQVLPSSATADIQITIGSSKAR